MLFDLGLIEWVPHLVESAAESGEFIHPLALRHSNTIGGRLAAAANDAAKALLMEGQLEWAIEKQGVQLFVPVPHHFIDVQVVGIARLRYRPHTRMTAAWWADLNENAEKHLARYHEIARTDIRAVM